VLVLGGFALMFWKFVPTPLLQVPYAPWFLDQVEADNIKGLLIRGEEIRGEVRKPAMYRSPASAHDDKVTRFLTHAPSPDCLAPVVSALRKPKAGREPVVIEAEPVSPLGELSWLLLLLPSILLLIMIAQLRILAERSGRRRG
jgi:cell division protease FtsH